MTDFNTLAERYVAVWNETDAARRKALIAETFAEDSFYVDPLMQAVGRDQLADLFVPLRIMVGDRELSLISMTSVFGTATDIELSELTLETFLPANPTSAEILRTLLNA